MKTHNTVKKICTAVAVSSLLSIPAYAAQHETTSEDMRPTHDATPHANGVKSDKSMETQAEDAWLEGKLDTIYLFNRHLNNFTIDPEVNHGALVLTGSVDSQVSKELAGQIAKGVEGITQVTNRLTVDTANREEQDKTNGDRDFYDQVEDATLTAEVKTRLLANGETSGLAISVDTVGREVTLTGAIDSSAEKDLAGEITRQVDGVESVNNELKVKK